MLLDTLAQISLGLQLADNILIALSALFDDFAKSDAGLCVVAEEFPDNVATGDSVEIFELVQLGHELVDTAELTLAVGEVEQRQAIFLHQLVGFGDLVHIERGVDDFANRITR